MGKLSVLVLLIVQAFYFSTQVSAVTFSDLNGSNGISSPELSKKQGISIIRIDVPWSEIESVKGIMIIQNMIMKLLGPKN